MTVDHVVVLMFENRSFDHMLGYLDHGGLEPVSEAVTNPHDPADTGAGSDAVFALPAQEDVPHDPGHKFTDVLEQITGREDGSWAASDRDNDGFVWNYGRHLACAGKDPALASRIMGCRKPEAVPALATLAREFAVCSRWHCSVPSETWPNRLFAHGAQSDALVHRVVQPYSHRTTFDQLEYNGKSWSVYAGDLPQTLSYMKLGYAFKDKFNRLTKFFDDVRENDLPQYSFIEPKHFIGPNSQHPTHGVVRGDLLLRRVYEALADQPEIWKSLLFIVTYDEHGGFFDRVAPQPATPPHEGVRDKEHGFGFDVLGPRVPSVIISPYVRAGTVDETLYDHTSIIRTVQEVFGIDESLTDRDRDATSVLHLLREQARLDPPSLPLPAVEALAAEAGAEGAAAPDRWAEGVAPDGALVLNDLQESLVELVAMLDRERSVAPLESFAAPPADRRFRSVAQMQAFVEGARQRHLGTKRA